MGAFHFFAQRREVVEYKEKTRRERREETIPKRVVLATWDIYAKIER